MNLSFFFGFCQDLPWPRSLPFFFGFITLCQKGVLLCIFICGTYFVDLWSWCNGPEFGFGEFILYIFERVANLVVKEEFFLCIWVMYIGFMYGFVIFMYYFLWFLYLSLWFLYLGLWFWKRKMRNLKINYYRFMWNLKSKIIVEI